MTVSASQTQVEGRDDFFEKHGPLPASMNDGRRFPRFYFRSYAEAIVYPLAGRQAPQPVQCFVLTSDLSRSGLSLLHDKQLFPGQRIDIVLNGQAPRPLEVVWCRRLAPGRYAAGCRWKSASSSS